MNLKLKTQVLKKIKASLKENLNIRKKVQKFISELENSTNNLGIECDFFVGGSFGKGTYLKGDFDVDIFCRFKTSKNISLELERILKNAKKKVLKQKGSRDYFQVYENKLKFELVPIKKIKKITDAENTTDHSPLHVDFVKTKVSKDKKLIDEIRLAKQFFKASKLYGAESYIGGFSGHIIDLLIIHYENFDKMLKGISSWREETIIDVNQCYKTNKETLSKIEKDKQSNLIIVDPILKTRNAARALNVEKYFQAILIAQEKLKRIEIKDFTIKKESSKEREKNAKLFAKKNNLKLVLYSIQIKKEIQSNDIVGSKLLKLFGRVEKYFEELDFNIFKSNFSISFEEEICQFIYFFEKTELSNIKKVMGPKVIMTSDIVKFLKNKKNSFVEGTRIYAYEKRKITKIQYCMK